MMQRILFLRDHTNLEAWITNLVSERVEDSWFYSESKALRGLWASPCAIIFGIFNILQNLTQK